jgi:hypothetical protein
MCIDLYEQLRAYVISPCKPISSPKGLDMWNRMGFKGWLIHIFNQEKCNEKQLMPLKMHKQDSEILSSITQELTVIFTNMILHSRRVKA